MINKIKSVFNSNHTKIDLQILKKNIAKIRHYTEVLCIYGSPTLGNWLGIANATKSLYPENSIEIPQHYSNSVFTTKQTIELCEFIDEQKFEKIIISGFASYFFNWIELLHDNCFIEIIFHGTISEFHDKSKQNYIERLIDFGKKEKIKRFGFVKKGLENVFSSLYQFNTYHQALPEPIIPENIKKMDLDKSKLHIGVFGADTFNKNLHNQVIHALMLDNTIIHVLDKSIFSYLQLDERIVEHGSNLTREKFLTVLGSMDLNLYMSFNESWGLVAYESEALGVPCLKSIDTQYLSEISNKLNL
jgi:hypothetical protein